MVTREVRWFQHGPIPDSVVDWFIGAVLFEMEQRVDRYDLAETRRGVGLKHRNMGSVDSKHRLDFDEGVELAPRLTGRVEDWLKITAPLPDPDEVFGSAVVDVAKDIFTRRYALSSANGNDSGCEAELAIISIGSVEAWTLCFETFGDPLYRADALLCGIDGFLGETPLPDGLSLDAGSSCGYPEWIRSRSLELV
jgi:hypothetical protein